MPRLSQCACALLSLAALLGWPLHAAESPPAPRGVGLVLGGGGARGLAHIGVLEELERLRVPIACVAGTSAGALVGGIYASGMPIEQIRREVEEADWNHLLSGSPRRADVPYARKQDDYKNLSGVTFGVGADGMRVPRSAISTQAIDAFLRTLTRDIRLDSFDNLPLPFQAVATDLVTGNMVVFDGGDLAIALRASMAVPGIFDLVEYDDKLLVDGMLTRNVPVANAKGRCADKVIVVDVGTPLLQAHQIKTLFDVRTQQSNILVGRNVAEQLALLTPDDVLIQPDLKDYGSEQFAAAREIIELGRKSVAPLSGRLADLAVSESEYAGWRATLAARAPETHRAYADVRSAPTRFVPPERVQASLEEEGRPTTQAELLARAQTLYDSGDFDQVNYVLRDEGGKRVVDVRPIERSVGPNYLRFGLDFKLDSYGTAEVGFLGNLQMTWLNQWGGQWRNDVRLSVNSTVSSEFFQPLGKSGLFASALLRWGRDEIDAFYQGEKLATFEVHESAAELGLGFSLGRYGETRLSYIRERIDGKLLVGTTLDRSEAEEQLHGLRAYLVVDQLDNPRFPRAGYYVLFDAQAGRNKRATSNDAYSAALVNLDYAWTLDRVTARGSLRFRGALEADGTTSDLRVFPLGGFLNLSGFQTKELVGQRTALGRLMLYRQLASILPAFGSGMYLGASFEGGQVWREAFTGTDTGWLTAGSVFVGVDSFLGPLYTAWGLGEGGRKAGYLYLGMSY